MTAFAARLKNTLKKTADAIERPHLKQRIIFMIIFTVVIFAFAVLFMPKTAFSYYNLRSGSYVSGEIVAGEDAYQPFTTGNAQAKSLLVSFNTYNRENYAVYNIEILDQDKNKLTDLGGNPFAPQVLNAVLIEDDEAYGIPLNMYDLKPNTQYYLHIYSDEAKPGNAVGLNISESETGQEELYIGDKPAGGITNMMVGYNRWSDKIIGLATAISAIICLTILFWSPSDIARNTLITVLTLGIMFAVITPIMQSPDEPFHVGTAFAFAEGNFLKTVDEGVSYTSGFISLNQAYGRVAFDTNQMVDLTNMPNFLNNEFTDVQIPADTVTTSWGAAKFFLGYIPQFIGLFIGRLLNVNLAVYFYIGRVFNVIAYAVCAYFAVKISPKFKLYLSIIALLPMSLFIAGSYNPDGLTYGLALLVGAKFADMFFNNDKLIGKKDIVVMAVFTALLCMNKYTLGLIALLPFFIPAKRYESRKLKWLGSLIILIISFIAAFAVLKWENYAASGTSSMSGEFVNERGANASLQLNWLLGNPGTAVSIFSNTIMRDIGDEMLNLFALGSTREYRLFDILSISYFAFLAVVAFACARYRTDDIKAAYVPVRTRVSILGVIAVTIILTYLALYLTWTPLYLNTIEGVQSRYFVGLFPLIPFLGQNIWPKVTKDALIRNSYNCLFIAVLIAALTLMTTVVRFY